MEDPRDLNQLQEELRSGKRNCVAMVEEYLQRIETQADLNLFIEVFAHDARSRATVIDAKIKHGTAGPLAGMIVGIKDNLVFKGHKASAASRMLENFESLFTATAVERLLEADAIIIGRLNCDEFAMGSANRFSYYGPAKNPHDPSKVPGGSSGGSAAAVAAGLCHLALGTDTGGSIRQPASFTGTLGFKPSYGRISRHGLIAFASSFDQIGPLARNPQDVAAAYQVMAGADDWDGTLSHQPVESPQDYPPQPVRFAYFKNALVHPKIDPEVREVFLAYLEELKAAGHQVEAVDFPLLAYLVPVYQILSTAEASSNLARYDGIHYGYRSEKAQDLESIYKLSRTEGFGPEVKRRILTGTFVLSSGYYEAYYGQAQKARQLVNSETKRLFETYDFLLSPTTPGPAFALDQTDEDPTKAYLEDIFTVHANLTGTPSISLPLFKHSNGLPFGLQCTAAALKDAPLLALARDLMSQ